MGCCVSKKERDEAQTAAVGEGVEARRQRVEARDPPPSEEEKVKEVLSETPSARARPRARRVVAGAVAPSSEREVEKVPRSKGGSGRVRDGCRSRRAAGVVEHGGASEQSEAASESSAATTATGPDRSPGKTARKRALSGELGRARRDRGPAVPGAGRPGGGRASPSPPPQREPGERPGRRSPSPAAKRPQDQRRVATGAGGATSCHQRKPPVPPRPCGRASPRRAQETPPHFSPPSSSTSTTTQPRGPPPHSASQPPPQARPQEAGPSATGVGDVVGDGEGKEESLENPSVAMECFIFL